MNLLDILLVLIVGGSTVAGFSAGFARAGLGFFAAIAGVLFGFWFYWIPAGWIHAHISSTTFSNVLGFIVLFFVFVLAGSLLGKLLAKLFKWTGLSWLDRILGAGFGFVRGTLVAAGFVAVVLAFTPKPTPNWMIGSAVLPYAIDASNMFASLAPRSLKTAFRDTMNEIRNDWDNELKRAEHPRKKEDRKKEDR